MQKFETRVGQFGLVGGVRQPTSDLALVAKPDSLFAPESHKGTLYIIVEAAAAAPRSQHACLLAVRTVRRAFYEDTTLSIAAAMRGAIAAANRAIYEQNIAQSAGKRATVGITVAVLKERDLFVAQVQPAQAYVLSESLLRAMPAHPSWDPAHVSVAPFTRSGALGASLFIDPEMYRCTLRPGESAILCSSGFAELLDRNETDRLLHIQDPAAAVEGLLQVAEQQRLDDAHALVIELRPPLSPAAQQVPLGVTGVSGRGWLAAHALRRWLTALTGGASHALRRRPMPPAEKGPPSPDPLHTMPDLPQYPVNPLPLPLPIDMGVSLGARYVRESEERALRGHRPDAASPELPPSAYLGEGFYPASSRPIDLGDGPALAAKARPYRTRYEMRPLVDLSWGERLALPFRLASLAIDDVRRSWRVRPTTPPQVVRGQGLSYRRTRPPFPWLLLFGLVLVISALIVYGMTLTTQNDQQVALEYFTAAENRLASVREASSEVSALDSLDLARQAINEVRASPIVTDTNPVLWLRYQELQREYERALAAVQRLTFFAGPVLLSTHPQPNGSFSDIIVPPATTTITDPNRLDGLRYLYTLDGDKANARLYRIPRDGGVPQPYLTPSNSVGTEIVGPLRAALWRIDQVVAVDQAPSGFGYYFLHNGSEWSYSKLGGSEIWSVRDRLSIKEYDGNLYVWGAVINEVLKFSSGSYGDTPEYWLDPASLTNVDISSVVDIAVDGEIYLLKSNGNVLIFSQGRLVSEIKPETITPPISAATRFFITNDGFGGGSIFLVEKQNERIIQMDKVTGNVIQQVKARPDGDLHLDHLDGISVDASGSRPILYLVNGGQIIRAELPDPPRPFRSQSGTPTPMKP